MSSSLSEQSQKEDSEVTELRKKENQEEEQESEESSSFDVRLGSPTEEKDMEEDNPNVKPEAEDITEPELSEIKEEDFKKDVTKHPIVVSLAQNVELEYQTRELSNIDERQEIRMETLFKDMASTKDMMKSSKRIALSHRDRSAIKEEFKLLYANFKRKIKSILASVSTLTQDQRRVSRLHVLMSMQNKKTKKVLSQSFWRADVEVELKKNLKGMAETLRITSPGWIEHKEDRLQLFDFFTNYRKFVLNILIPLESPMIRTSYFCTQCKDTCYSKKAWVKGNKQARTTLVEMKELFSQDDSEEEAKERFFKVLAKYNLTDQEELEDMLIPNLYMPKSQENKQKHTCFDQKGKPKKRGADRQKKGQPKKLQGNSMVDQLNGLLANIQKKDQPKLKAEAKPKVSQRPALERVPSQQAEFLGKRQPNSQGESTLDIKSLIKREDITDLSKPESLTIDQTNLSCYKEVTINFRDNRPPLNLPAHLLKNIILKDKCSFLPK